MNFYFSESGFMCLEVNYRSENVISAKIGRLSRNREEACDRQLFFDTSIQSTTLISKQPFWSRFRHGYTFKNYDAEHS